MNQKELADNLLRTIDIISQNTTAISNNSQPKLILGKVTDISRRAESVYGVTYQRREVYAKNSGVLRYELGDLVYIMFPTADEGDPNIILLGAAAATTPQIPDADVSSIPKTSILALFNAPIDPDDTTSSIISNSLIRDLFNEGE